MDLSAFLSSPILSVDAAAPPPSAHEGSGRFRWLRIRLVRCFHLSRWAPGTGLVCIWGGVGSCRDVGRDLLLRPMRRSVLEFGVIGQRPVRFPRFFTCVVFLRTRSVLCIFNFARRRICVDSFDLFFFGVLWRVWQFSSVARLVLAVFLNWGCFSLALIIIRLRSDIDIYQVH